MGLAVASSQRTNQNSPTAAATAAGTPKGGHNGQNGRKLKPAATLALHEFKRSKRNISSIAVLHWWLLSR